MNNYRYDVREAHVYGVDTHPVKLMVDVLHADVIDVEQGAVRYKWYIRTLDALPVLPPFVKKLPDDFRFGNEIK